MPIINGQTEELLKAVPTPHVLRLGRQKFRRLLATGIEIEVFEGNVVFERTFRLSLGSMANVYKKSSLMVL